MAGHDGGGCGGGGGVNRSIVVMVVRVVVQVAICTDHGNSRELNLVGWKLP